VRACVCACVCVCVEGATGRRTLAVRSGCATHTHTATQSHTQPHTRAQTHTPRPQVQTVSFLSHLRSKGVNGPFLIIGPLSTLRNWSSEVTRWCPSMPVIEYHGSGAKARAALRAQHMPLPGRGALVCRGEGEWQGLGGACRQRRSSSPVPVIGISRLTGPNIHPAHTPARARGQTAAWRPASRWCAPRMRL
jgi:hypothetical protein